jgi:tetratricopeptide (TPR) repeat protein
MAEISKRTKRLTGELGVLVCVICFFFAKSTIIDMNDVKAEAFKHLVVAEPDNAEAYRFLAVYYMDLGAYERAVKALREVVRIEPNDGPAYSMLGDAYWNCGHYEKAMLAYRRAMKLQVNNPMTHYQMAKAYLKMGDKDSALEEYEILKGLDEKLANELLTLLRE